METIKSIIGIAKSAIFQCSICQENIKDPLLLPCNHCFCSLCLKNYQLSCLDKNSKNLSCPNCLKVFTKRSTHSAPDLEGQLFKDLILALEVGTGIDLTNVHAKQPPIVEYDKERYKLKQNANINTRKSKTSVKKEKEVNKRTTKERIGANLTEKPNVKNTSGKRSLSGTETDSTSKRRKKGTSAKQTDGQIQPSPKDLKNGNIFGGDSVFVQSTIQIDSSTSSVSSAWKIEKVKPLKTYKRKTSVKKIEDVPSSDSEGPMNCVKKVENWLVKLPNEVVKKSKSMTPTKQPKVSIAKNKSLNDIISNNRTTEIARNLESKVLNDLLQMVPPKTSSKENWSRVKKEFRTSKFNKLNLSVQPSNRKSVKSKNSPKSTKTKAVIAVDTNSVVETQNDDDKLILLVPHVVLENLENSFCGFESNEQQISKIEKDKLLTTSQNMSNSLMKSSKIITNLIDKLTSKILNENVQFSNYSTFKECTNIAKKLRALTNLEEIDKIASLHKRDVGINTEDAGNICSNCRLSDKHVDLTQKISKADNMLISTQRSKKLTQLSGEIFADSNENQNREELSGSNSESESLKYFTPKNLSNTSKFMHDIIYEMSDMEFTQTVVSKNTVSGLELKGNNGKVDSMSESDNDDDIVESTPKSHTSASRIKNLTQKLSIQSQKEAQFCPPSNVMNNKKNLRSTSEKLVSSGSELSEHPSIILGTEYTQKAPPHFRGRKRPRENDDDRLDVTLIEPIETQAVSSLPVVMDLPPPTEFMDSEHDDVRIKRNNLNNFSALPETTMVKNSETLISDINIKQLKEGSILYDQSEKVPIVSSESVVEQTPLSGYLPKTRINLSNTRAFKQIAKRLSTESQSDQEEINNPLEIVRENTPRRLYNGPSNSKQISILSYVNSSQENRAKLSESHASTPINVTSTSSDRRLSSTRRNPSLLNELPVSKSFANSSQAKLSKSQVIPFKHVTNTPVGRKLSSMVDPLPISMSSQKKNNIMNDTFRSQFDTPSSQMFANPMASSTPTRLVSKSARQLKLLHSSMELFWTRLTVSEINLLTDFCKQFKIKSTTENNDTATHLITRVDENNCIEDYTLKYVCAVARGVWVLSFKWIEDCLDNNKILPEEPYEALDTSGSPGPKMSRTREKSSFLLEKFAACVLSSPLTFPKDKLINCILQNGGTIYSTVEELAAHEGKIRLIITETPETQDIHTFQDYFERYGILSIITEWVFNTIATFKVESLASYLACNITDMVSDEYPPELLMESETMCDFTYV